VRQRQEVQEVPRSDGLGAPEALLTDFVPLGYTSPRMSEKTQIQAATAADYQELLPSYRDKLAWVRDYL
jgi:hypothetical protein